MSQPGRPARQACQDPGRAAQLCLAALFLIFFCAAAAEAGSKIPFLDTDTIEQLRDKIEKNGYHFTVGHTRLDDMTAEQRAGLRRPRLAPPPEKRVVAPHSDVILAPETQALSLPAKFDWRNYNGRSYVGPVRDQGNLGSCYAFGAAAVAEAAYNIANGLYDANRVDFSEMHIIWTLSSVAPYSGHFGGGDGSDAEYYELYGLTRSGPPEGPVGFEGIIAEAVFPYSDSALPPAQADIDSAKQQPRALFRQWRRVYPANYDDTTEQMKVAIMTYGALDVAIQTDSGFDRYTGGIYENNNTEPDAEPYYYTTTDHVVSLVGWDDDPDDDPDNEPGAGDGCWILRNSYGATGWGENGYMRIRYFAAAVNTSAAYLVPETADGPYGISGAVSGAVQTGVTVSLTGAHTAATLTASDGTYSFSGLTDGAYTVIPAKSGYAFSPARTEVVIAGESLPGVRFTASAGATTTTTTAWDDDEPCLSEQALGAGSPDLVHLRNFRDDILAKSAVGRAMIHCYYRNSPRITAAFARCPALRAAAHRILAAIARVAGQ